MPLKSFCCSVCGRCAPRKYLAHGQFGNRMRWLRRHYKRHHPKKFRAMYQAGDLEEAAELGAMVHKDKNGGEMEVAELKRYAEVRLGDNNG